MGKKVVVIGGGGHARAVLDILLQTKGLEIVGFTSPARDHRTEALTGVAYAGPDEVLPQVYARGIEYAFVAIGDNQLRKSRLEHARVLGFTLINALSPHAVVSARASIGTGVAILPGAVVNAGTTIGDGSIINTNASIDHDCVIGEFVHVAPACALAGNVVVGAQAMLGIGTRVIPGISIGSGTVVGAGSVVLKDLPRLCIAIGTPAVVRRKLQEAM